MEETWQGFPLHKREESGGGASVSGESTGWQAAWAWARAGGERTCKQASLQAVVFFLGPFFSLYTKIYHTVGLELQKRYPIFSFPLFLNSSVIDCSFDGDEYFSSHGNNFFILFDCGVDVSRLAVGLSVRGGVSVTT